MKMRPFICTYDDCDKSYSLAHHLKRHEASHERNIKCTEKDCNQVFKNKYYLKKHMDLVHEKKKPKKYKCSECGEEFNKHNWLTSHQYKHTGISPYVCPTEGCDKRFVLPSKLKRHMKTHEGYPCTVENCKEISSTWTLHRRHLKLSHPTIYKCEYCEKTFLRSYNLKEHMKFHKLEKELFPCPKPNCSRVYTSQHILNDHIKAYHDKRPFVCPVEHCYKAFKTEDDLTAHHSRHLRRTRRKKKKGNPGPSFASKLAGLAPKKWQTELLSGDKIESDEETSEESSSETGRSLGNSSLDNSKQEVSILSSLEEPILDNSKEEVSTPNSLEEPEANTYMEITVKISLAEPEAHISEDIYEPTNLKEPEVNTSRNIFQPDLLASSVDENNFTQYKDTKVLKVAIHRDCIIENAVKNMISDQKSEILTDASCCSTEVSDVQLFCKVLCNDGKTRHFPDLLSSNPNLN